MKVMLIILAILVVSGMGTQRIVMDTTITADTLEFIKYDTLIIKRTINDTSFVVKEDTLKAIVEPVKKKKK